MVAEATDSGEALLSLPLIAEGLRYQQMNAGARGPVVNAPHCELVSCYNQLV